MLTVMQPLLSNGKFMPRM